MSFRSQPNNGVVAGNQKPKLKVHTMSGAARKDALQALPDEVLVAVVAACATQHALQSIACTSWRLNQLCHHYDEQLWRPLCLTRFPRLHAVVAAASAAFSFRDLYIGELVAEVTSATARHLPSLPSTQQVLEQFVISMELHISTEKPKGIRFVPEPSPSTETPGLIARWTGRPDELGEQRFWSPEAMPHWLRPDATCDTFSRVFLVVYLTWLHRAPRTLKLYHGAYAGGNDEGFCLCSEGLGCGPDECDGGSTLHGGMRPDLMREAGMMPSVAEHDGHVQLGFGYAVSIQEEDEDWLCVGDGHEQQARFMAMHFPSLPWPQLPKRPLAATRGAAQLQGAPKG